MRANIPHTAQNSYSKIVSIVFLPSAKKKHLGIWNLVSRKKKTEENRRSVQWIRTRKAKKANTRQKNHKIFLSARRNEMNTTKEKDAPCASEIWFPVTNFFLLFFSIIPTRIVNHCSLLHGVLLRPFPGQLVVAVSIGLVNTRDFWHQRIVGIRIAQQWANAQKHFRYGQRRRPLTAQNVQANAAVAVDVRMINSRRESDFRRFERIISREMNRQEENAALIRTVRRSHDRGLPMEQIVANRASGT